MSEANAPATVTVKPTAPAPAKLNFGEPVANILGQVLPHFDKIRNETQQLARDAAYNFIKGGGTDEAAKSQAVKLVQRAELYASTSLSLIADPLLPPDLAKWYHAQQG